jgi:hypothetical protein
MNDIIPTPNTQATDLSAAQIASARDHWISLGLDAGQFDSAMAPAPDNTTGAPAPAATVQDDRAGIEIMGADKAPQFSQAEAEQMAQALRDQGYDEARIVAAMAESGYEPLAPDLRTEDEREFDRAFPAPSPSSYTPNYRECTSETDVAKIAATNTEFTTWAADLALPAEIGTYLIEEALRVEGATARMTEPGRQLWVREQRAAFANLVGGPEKVEEKLAMVRPLLERNPAMRDRLHRTGALDSAAVVIHLAHHAERQAVRVGRIVFNNS